MSYSLTTYDWYFIIFCVVSFSYRYQYVALDEESGDFDVVRLKTKLFFVFVLVWVFLLYLPQSAFNAKFDTFWAVGFLYATIPFVGWIALWESKPRWLVVYTPVLYFWLTMFRDIY